MFEESDLFHVLVCMNMRSPQLQKKFFRRAGFDIVEVEVVLGIEPFDQDPDRSMRRGPTNPANSHQRVTPPNRARGQLTRPPPPVAATLNRGN